MARMLGFCTECFRVRWLARVERRDRRGNAHGVCTQCVREKEERDAART